jgi:hypothetical protein
LAFDNPGTDGERSTTRREARRLWSHPLGDVFACGGRMLTLVPTVDGAGDLERVAALVRGLRGRSILPPTDLRLLSDGRVVAKTELPSGVSLGQRLGNGPLEPARALGILRQVARALAGGQRIGLPHGALSLASVIVGIRDGRRDAVQVVDFGLGELEWKERDSEASRLPLSPERALGLPREATEDAYLFGCVAFTVLTGRPVFDGDCVSEVRRRHAIEDAADLGDLREGRAVPEPVRRFVARCLEKDPDERYPGAAELEAALCEAQLEADIVTAWDDLPAPAVAPERRRAIADGLERKWFNETRREAAESGVFLAPERGRLRPRRKARAVPPPRATSAGVPRSVPGPDRTPVIETRLLGPQAGDATPRPIPVEMDRTPIVATVCRPAPGSQRR